MYLHTQSVISSHSASSEFASHACSNQRPSACLMNHTANNSTVSHRVTCAPIVMRTLPHIITLTLLSHVISFYAWRPFPWFCIWYRLFFPPPCSVVVLSNCSFESLLSVFCVIELGLLLTFSQTLSNNVIYKLLVSKQVQAIAKCLMLLHYKFKLCKLY